jgi:hypothetical protein
MEDEPMSWVVEGLIAEGSVTELTGISGSGKSYFALDMCRAITTGRPFAGMRTVKRDGLYLDREAPKWLIKSRMKQMGIEDGGNFQYWGNWVAAKPEGDEGKLVREYVAITEPKPFLVVDTITAFFEGASENDAVAVRAHMDVYRKFADQGATVVALLHASEKGGNARVYRGSSDFKASVDTGYLVRKLNKGPLLEDLELSNFKSRYPVAERLKLHFDGTAFSMDKSPAATNTQLLTLLQAHPDIKQTDFEKLGTEQHVERDSIRKWLETGVQARDIRCTKGEKNSKRYTWVGVV